MTKRDFTNRVSIDRALIPVLLKSGEGLLYDDLCGIVNHALREWVAGNSTTTQTSLQTSPAQTPQDPDPFADIDIDLSA